MKLSSVVLAVCALVLLLPSYPTLASIPGNIELVANDGLLHVCRDVEPGSPSYIVCDDLADSPPPNDQNSYSGDECAAVGMPRACRIDFIPQPRLQGGLALFGDEAALNPDADSTTQSTLSGLTITLTFGLKKITFVDLFDGTKIGNWNAFTEQELAAEAFVFEFTNPPLKDAFQFSYGNLAELGLQIRNVAQFYYPDADLSNAVPVLVNVVSDWNKVGVDGTGTDLGSANYFRVFLRFARVRP